VQLYFRVTPLGLPRRYGPSDVVAVTAKFDSRTLARLREMRGDTNSVLYQPIQVQAARSLLA
jgi:acyl-homoserine lactone synthase